MSTASYGNDPFQYARWSSLIMAIVSLIAAAWYLSFETPPSFETSFLDSPQTSTPNVESNKIEIRRRKLGDGCYHIFLDVGANIGLHARFLYEPHSYPEAETAKSIFETEFGTTARDNRDFCVFAFEPNPIHRARHEKLKKHFEESGLHYRHVPVAVSDFDGNMTFFHNDDANDEEQGFSDHKVAGDKAVEEVVPVIRLADWIMNEIYERELPSKIYGNYSDITPKNAPKVVMKMDIETQEHAVVPDLMYSGVLCQTVDFAFGEFHYPSVRYGPGADGRGGLTLQEGQDAQNYVEQLLRAFHSVQDCVTKEFSQLTEGSYLHDDVPL
ncbi:hypothetical protein HJC23_013017 [Cyclotella cryptica]|uniref:Methyltransferase FkbM domain-containing protein n=1 Tax=Cyclotella cryptica TaxID=29204 RepID=A0ABD3QGW6_9STRA|eukprot:CCRYP_005623-RA/>CCRYP_005623-RA protein AED:0.04 eAED:0.04 QI:0/-1/0/1/-1/1/1/0/326